MVNCSVNNSNVVPVVLVVLSLSTGTVFFYFKTNQIIYVVYYICILILYLRSNIHHGKNHLK